MSFDVTLELFYDGGWHDVTELAGRRRIRRSDGIGIRCGTPNEGSGLESSECGLKINTADGVFSPRNPRSPLYGKIGRNTPCRLAIDGAYRFAGEVASFPQKWDLAGRDVWASIAAAGIARRFGQADLPVAALRQFILDNLSTADRYWPLDEGESSTSWWTVLPNGTRSPTNPFTVFLASVRGGSGDLSPLPSGLEFVTSDHPFFHSDGVFQTTTPVGSTRRTVDFVFRSPALGVLEVTVGRWSAQLRGNGTNNDVRLLLDDVVQDTEADHPAVTDGALHHVRIDLLESGGSLVSTVSIDGTAAVTDTAASTVLGAPTTLSFKYDPTYEQSVALGQVVCWIDGPPALADTVDATFAYAGEAAGRRIERLCSENAIAFTSVGDLDDTVAMGPQTAANLSAALEECVLVDGGILSEQLDELGLHYRTRVTLYNQAAQLTLPHNGRVLSESPEIVEDDQATRNDITATRPDGGSARAVLTTGSLSIQDPPDGVGPYPTPITRNVSGDELLPDQAAWAMHHGTVDEARIPILAINLAAPAFVRDAGLTAAAVEVVLGDVVEITNPPAWLPPEPIRQIVRGYAEAIDGTTWAIVYNTTPESPYQVADDTADRFDTVGSELAGSANSTTTTLLVDPSVAAAFTEWTSDPAAFPLDIHVAGEQITVTNIAGSSPQIFTVIRSVNGVVKSHAVGTKVRLWKTPRYAL